MTKVCFYRPTRKKPRTWTSRDVARVANYVVESKRSSQYAVLLDIFGEEGFTADDTVRALEPAMGAYRTIRMVRRWAKLLILLLGVLEVLTAGATVAFLLPLQVELAALVVALGIFAAELRALKKYVIAVRKMVGEDPNRGSIELPSDEEIDDAIKEADNAASKVGKFLDSLDVVFD